MPLGALLLVIGTLVIVVPTRDGLVIVTDSKSTRRTAGGAPAVSATEKVFALEGVDGHAFFVTGASPVEWVVEGQGVATVVDARGVVRARLSRRGPVSREQFEAVAAECARLASRIHRMGAAAAPLAGRDLFSVVMARAGSAAEPREISSFVVRLTAAGAEVADREVVRFAAGDAARVLMFGEGAFVGAGLAQWTGGSADCARQFLGSGRRRVRDTESSTAARGAYAIQEAASTAMGDGGTVGPPFRSYVLTRRLTELPPVAPCR